MSTRSIKTLVSTVIDNEVYDSNRIARLIDNLELYQNKVDNLVNDISNIPQSLADVSAIKMELDDLSANVAEIDARVNQHDIDISSIYLSIDDINSQLDALPTDITTITSSVTTLQIDVSALQIDVSGIYGNLTKAEADILDLSYQISLLPTDVGSIVADIQTLQSITGDLSAVLYPVSTQTTQNTNTINDLSTNVYLLNATNVKTSGTQTIDGNKTFSGITRFTNATPALSATNASVMVSGGIGISGNAYVNSSLYVSGTTEHSGDVYVRGNITQNDNNSVIIQSGTGTNILKNTTINALTVTTINGITNSKLQYVNSTAVYDLVVQGGITPDSIQEITQTLQSAITLAYNAGYRHFYLPKGTYIVRDITLGQGAVFYGDGRETILKIPNSSSIIFPQEQCAVFSLNQANITIKDLTVDGNRTNVAFSNSATDYQYEGIALDTGANYTTIENVYMINTYNDGLDMDNVNSCIVRNSWFINCGGHGIHLNGEGGAGYNCVNNIIDNCIIENCGLISILGATFSGIHCNSQAGHNTISNITVINCAYGGIKNSGTNNIWTNILVRNNTTTGTGIFIASTALCTNIDSVILQGGAIGIDCQGNRSTISSIQMDTIATTGITISGAGNTLNNLSLNTVGGSPLLISGSNTIIDDMYMNGVALAIEIQGTNNILTNFAIRSATKKIQVGASRSSFANFHWIDSDATITDTYVFSFASGASYNSIVNMSYSGNRSVHFESATACLYNRFINGYIASGFTANVLTQENNTYILGVNTSSSVINLIRGNVELGANDSIKQSGTGIFDQSGNGTNIMKSTILNGNLQIKTNASGLRLVSADGVNGTNGQIIMKADASDNDFNRLVDARDSVIYSTKGTMNSGVLTLTTESNVGDVGIRITPENMYIRAPLNIELSGNVYLNGERLIAFGDVTADLLQLQTDVSFLQTDVSFLQTEVSLLQTDISNIIADISDVKIDISAVQFDISGLKLTDLQNVKITGDQDISGVKSFTSVLNVKNATNSGSTTSGALVVSGGIGVALDSNFGGNISLSSGNITQSSGGVIRQSGTGTNVFKASEMTGQLDMSYQSIIDVSAIIGTGANIVIQPNNNVRIRAARDITLLPEVSPKILLMNFRSGDPYSAGLVLEETAQGNILSYGINIPQFDSTNQREIARAGGLFRFDTRGGSNQLFQILTYKEGANLVTTQALTINSDGNVRMNATSSSINTNTGALVVSGGVGIGENLYVNSLLRVNSTTNSTSVGSGAVVVSGGIGIGGNTNIGGNILINSTFGATNTTTGALQVKGGAGIVENVYVGGIGVINSTTENTGVNTGAFRVAGGASISANAYIGGNATINSSLGATNTSSGALQVKGGVGIAENVYVGGIGVINSTTENTGVNTGAFRVAGGASIGANAYIGGNTLINSTVSSTSSSTGAFQVKGGAGIAANLYIGGQTFVKNSAASLGNSGEGALQVDGGVGVGGNIFVNNIIRTGELFHNKKIVVLDASMTEDPSGATQFYGFGANTDTLRYQTPTIDSVHRFYSGTEPGLLSAGKLSLTTNIESTNTDTGTLRVAGGVGILGDVNIGSSVNITQGLRVNSANNFNNKLLVLHTTNPSSSTEFFGFGVNADTLRYQTSATDKAHRFYSGTDAGILHAGQLDLSSNIESNNTTTGTLRISGGAGISGNLYVGGNHILSSQTDATSISTGAFQVSGGVGIAKNMYVGGQTVIGNALPSLGNSETGALQVSGGVGVGGNVFVDNMIRMKDNQFNKKLVLLDASVNESPDNAKLFYGFGVNSNTLRYQTEASSAVHRFYSGENDGSIVAGNIVLLGENTSLDASSGALVVAGGVGVGANLNVRGITVIENTTPSTTLNSAALVIKGGTSITGDIIVGGNLLISGATSFTGADISGITTFRNDSQSIDPSGGAVIIYGGLGVGKDISVRGNINVSDTGNLTLLGNSTILQNESTLGVNSLKATKMSGNLDLSLNHIINASSLTTDGNISISSTNKVVFQGNDAVSIYTYVPPNAPSTTKNAIYINEPAKSGIAGETDSGNSLIIGINTSHLGERNNSLQGVIAKFDSRVGQPLFSIETAAGGETNTFQALVIDSSYNTSISGNSLISATTDSLSTNSGALRVSGGAGIAANLYVGGNIVITNETNSSSTNTGSLQVAGGVGIGGNVYIKGATVITDTTNTTDTTAGALRVSGGISIGGNLYAENIVRIANASNNKKVVLQDLSVNEIADTATQFFGFGVNPDSLRYQTGNTSTVHKFYSGTNDGILQAGNLTLTRNAAATNTSSGTLIVGGGAGIAGNMYVGGLLYNANNTESTSISTGAGVFTGGVGIGANIYVGGNAVIGANIIQSANGSTIRQSGTGINVFKASEMVGTLDMSYQSIIDVSAIIGTGANIVIQPNNNVVIKGDRDITFAPRQPVNAQSTTKSGMLLLNSQNAPYSAGLVLEETEAGNILSYGINVPQVGTRVNSIAGGIFRFDTRAGDQLFQIVMYKEGATTAQPSFPLTINSDGNVRMNATSSSINTNTGALVVSGGVGIGENLYVNSLLRVNSTTESTSVGSGAVVVSGGVGIGGNVYIGRNANIGENMNVSGTTRITNSTQATSTTTGAFSISGGASMGGNLYVGGNLVLNGAINSTTTSSGTLIVNGGVGISQNMYVGGSINQDNNNFIQTGIGIINQSGSGQNTLKQTYISSSFGSTTTDSGALTVVGGVGIGGNLLAAKAFIGTTQRKEFDVDINGNVSIGASVTTYPAFDSNYLRRTLNIMDTNASMKIARFNAASVPVLEFENYNATTLLHAWRMEAGSQLQFKYTAGATPATSTEIFRIDSAYAQALPTAESTSVGTGAFRVSGGASVAANLFVGGNVSLTGQNIVQTNASIISQTGSGTNTMKAINITDTTDSTGATVGALRVNGGAGILGNVVLGNTLGISSTIGVIESTTSGALRVAGGASIAGNAYVAGVHRMGGANNNKKIVLSDEDTTESATSGTNFYGFGKNANTLRYQAPTSATHKFFTGSSSGNVEMGQLTLTSATPSTTTNTGALIVSGGIGVGGNINVVGNVSIGTGKQVLITTDATNDAPNTLVDANDSVVAGVDESAQNAGVLTLTTRSDQGDVGIRITNQNITMKAPTDVDIAALMRVQRLSENFTLATIASNTVTVNFSTTNSAYYMVPSTSTNLSFVIQSVPTSKTYSSYTLTFAIDTSTYKVYGNSVNVNGNAVVLKYGLGSAHTSVNDINFLVQQVVIFFTNSTTPNAVLTSITGYS